MGYIGCQRKEATDGSQEKDRTASRVEEVARRTGGVARAKEQGAKEAFLGA